jgi:hypothetical protein
MTQYGDGTEYNTDRAVSGTLPDLKAPSIVSATRTTLVLKFDDLSPYNQDSFQSGDTIFTMHMDYEISLGWLPSSYTRQVLPVQTSYVPFTIKADDPIIVENENVLSSDSQKLTIVGQGFDALADMSFDFDKSSAHAIMISATYSSLVISFDKLSAATTGDLQAQIEINDSFCWNDSCSEQCSGNPVVNNSNTSDSRCDGTKAMQTCAFTCLDTFVPSSVATCNGLGQWEESSLRCNAQCTLSFIPSHTRSLFLQ